MWILNKHCKRPLVIKNLAFHLVLTKRVPLSQGKPRSAVPQELVWQAKLKSLSSQARVPTPRPSRQGFSFRSKYYTYIVLKVKNIVVPYFVEDVHNVLLILSGLCLGVTRLYCFKAWLLSSTDSLVEHRQYTVKRFFSQKIYKIRKWWMTEYSFVILS